MIASVRFDTMMVTVWRENPQVDGDGRDALVGASYPVGLGLDFRAYLVEIHKLLSFAVQEFSIFCTWCKGGGGGWVGESNVQEGGWAEGQRRTKDDKRKVENIRVRR